jgi:hypothetical protein
MMSLNVHFKSKKWKVLLIMDDFATHSLEHADRDESFGFLNLAVEQYYYFFLTA